MLPGRPIINQLSSSMKFTLYLHEHRGQYTYGFIDRSGIATKYEIAGPSYQAKDIKERYERAIGTLLDSGQYKPENMISINEFNKSIDFLVIKYYVGDIKKW